jgi:hypothetical protein
MPDAVAAYAHNGGRRCRLIDGEWWYGDDYQYVCNADHSMPPIPVEVDVTDRIRSMTMFRGKDTWKKFPTPEAELICTKLVPDIMTRF